MRPKPAPTTGPLIVVSEFATASVPDRWSVNVPERASVPVSAEPSVSWAAFDPKMIGLASDRAAALAERSVELASKSTAAVPRARSFPTAIVPLPVPETPTLNRRTGSSVKALLLLPSSTSVPPPIIRSPTFDGSLMLFVIRSVEPASTRSRVPLLAAKLKFVSVLEPLTLTSTPVCA